MTKPRKKKKPVLPEDVLDPAESITNAFQAVADFQILPAEDLLHIKFPELEWCIPSLLPVTGLVILAGVPKVGKSWLALEIATSVASGNNFLQNREWKPESKKVLYASLEDYPRRTQDRLVKYGNTPGEFKNLDFLYEMKELNGSGITSLSKYITTKPDTGLVIIDTLARARSSALNTKDGYQVDAEFTGSLQSLAVKNNMVILLVHHTKKQKEEDVFAKVSGTYGINASADVLMVLERGRNSGEAKLSITGRDIPEAEHAVIFKKYRWKYIGEAAVTMISDERKAILNCLDEMGPIKPKQIADHLGKDGGAVRKLLKGMVDNQQVIRDSNGNYLSEIYRMKMVNDKFNKIPSFIYSHKKKRKKKRVHLSL